MAEQFADGRADDRRRAEAEALDAYEGELDRDDEFRVWSEPVLILVAGSPFPWEAAADCARHIIWDAGYVGLDHSFEGVGEELGVEQADLLRDIFGNTVRQVAFDPSWRTSTAVALAKWMYEARDFTAAPILADALEDGGCNDENTLNHLRGPGAHVRGCWPVDLVLGRG